MTTNNNGTTVDELVDGPEGAIYENTNYEVVILYIGEDADPYVDGKFVYRTAYAVSNKITGVIEHVCVQLPEAIFTAVGLDAALEKAPWNWAKGEPAPAPIVN